MPEFDASLFCVDMGTTRTRVWLTERKRVLSWQAADFGARDTPHRSTRWLADQLLALMDQVFQASDTPVARPRYAVAAGMITSSQGMYDLPHVSGPAGVAEIAAGMHAIELLPSLTLLLVPGVRTGSRKNAHDVSHLDIMRGEETLCIGLLENKTLRSNMTLLHLGSHWKSIFIDGASRIAASRTSLTGELIHAVQANTLLSASLPNARPESFDMDWVQHGLSVSSAEGLGRTLFCVRLLHLQGSSTEVQRVSFLYGAFIAQELQSLQRHLSSHHQPVLITGHSALAGLWNTCLQQIPVPALVLDEAARDAAYLNGLSIISERSGLLI